MSYQLVEVEQLENNLTNIANILRDKSKNTNKLSFPQGYIDELTKRDLEPLDVDFIDYDGTLLYTYTATDFLALTELPPNPTRQGLTAQGWNWTLADAKEYVGKYGALVIGQSYITSDGKTRIYITVTQSYVDLRCVFSIRLYCISNGGGTIDWGDGTSASIGSAAGAKNLNHTYNTAGDFIITISLTGGSYAFGYQGSNANAFDNPSDSTTGGKVSTAIKAVELGSYITKFGRQPFRNCYFLQYVTIPKTITGFNEPNTASDGAAFNSVVMKGLVFPSGFDGKNSNLVVGSFDSMKYIALPKSLTHFSISGTGFDLRKFTIYFLDATTSTIKLNYSKMVTHFIMPGNYTTLASVTCEGSMVKKVIIPETVTTIQTEAYMYNYFLQEIHVLSTSVPTLSNTRAFKGLGSNCKIYIPYSEDHSILEAYKIATNWSTYASYMEEEPQQ